MTHDADLDAAVELQFERLRLNKQRRAERASNGNYETVPKIKMLVGDWYVDELGVLMREITARN